jgi:hypothetical protein
MFCHAAVIILLNTGYTQKNCAVSKVNKKSVSQLTRAQYTPSVAATSCNYSRALITNLQCVHPGSVVHELSDHEVHEWTWAMVVHKRCL